MPPAQLMSPKLGGRGPNERACPPTSGIAGTFRRAVKGVVAHPRRSHSGGGVVAWCAFWCNSGIDFW